jgi:hypothetical protein
MCVPLYHPASQLALLLRSSRTWVYLPATAVTLSVAIVQYMFLSLLHAAIHYRFRVPPGASHLLLLHNNS